VLGSPHASGATARQGPGGQGGDRLLHVIANARLTLLLDGKPLLVVPVPALAAAMLLPLAVALLTVR
jgi:hypothetical protein